METLAFYSYTGGVRRSLLLVDAARYLAFSLDKRVVAVDLDFEAPGLHYRFSEGFRGELPIRGGAVPYLVSTAQGAVSPPPLDEHVVEVRKPADAFGWLRLMPAGPAPDRTYWATFKELGERLHLDDASGEGVMAVLDLHARIQDELSPDYLLIDTPSGITKLGGVATTVLANTVVCIVTVDHWSLDGTVAVVEALATAPRRHGPDSLRIVPVLTSHRDRLPYSAEAFGDGVDRLLELGEAKDALADPPIPFFLPDPDEDPYPAERELFKRLFLDSAENTRQTLNSLEAG